MTYLATTDDFDVDLAAAFDASPDPYMLLTRDLRFAGVNQAYLDVMRRRREDLIGAGVFDAFSGGAGAEADESVSQLRTSFEKVLATGEADHVAVIKYAIPIAAPDGTMAFEDRYWTAVHTPVRGKDGAVAYIVQQCADITATERLRQRIVASDAATIVNALDADSGDDSSRRARLVQRYNHRLGTERSRMVEMFMPAQGFVAIMTGPNHVFQLTNPAYEQLLNHRDMIGRPLSDAAPEFESQGYLELLDHVYATGERYEAHASHLALQRSPNGPLEEVYLDFIYSAIRDELGEIIGIFVQGYEVTEGVRTRERQKFMIDELNHRVKNTLATVQSIAVQTARSHADPATFADTFQARLMSLSHTHDLLTRGHWAGADLRDILKHETDAHGPTRVVLNGPLLALGPAAALSLGMIFHELVTNASKYGALSIGAGRVFIDWSVADQSARRLTLHWREQGGPPVSEPTRRGFGTRLIERNVRHDLAGEAKLSYPSDGFIAEISIPLDRGG